jgi:hypothetical protein
VNRAGTDRTASAARSARRPERGASSETARRDHRKEGDVTTRTGASATDGTDGPAGHAGEPEAGIGAFGHRERRRRNRPHLGGEGSGINREPAAGTPSPLASARGRETKPHGREWSKHTTGSGGEQTVKVVRNGEGGRRGCGNPRRGQTGKRNGVIRGAEGRAGTRIPRAGSAGGAGNPTGAGRVERTAVVSHPQGTDDVENAVLEGARKAMSGEQTR